MLKVYRFLVRASNYDGFHSNNSVCISITEKPFSGSAIKVCIVLYCIVLYCIVWKSDVKYFSLNIASEKFMNWKLLALEKGF